MASVAVVPAVVSRPSAHALAYAGLAVATVGWTAGFIAGKLALAEMTPLPVLTALASAVLLGERLAVAQAFGGGGRRPGRRVLHDARRWRHRVTLDGGNGTR